MKIWVAILRIVGLLWMAFATVAILVGTIGIWIKNGFYAVLDMFSPFSVTNWIVVLITFVPGMATLMLADRINRK